MKTFRLSSKARGLSVAAIFLCAVSGLLGQAARGGNSLGTPGLALPAVDPYQMIQGRILSFALDDLELTALTRMDEQLEKELEAVNSARTAVLAATFAPATKPAELAAKVEALAAADLRLALARSEAWQKLQVQLKPTPQKLAAIRRTMSATVLGGGAGGVAP